MNQSEYCYPNTNVLINKLGITDAKKLEKTERDLTGFRILQLKKNPIRGSFDMEHLKEIHKYIFQDVYEWAGKLRHVDISKGIWFARHNYIPLEGQKLFFNLKRERYLADMPFDKFCERLAHYKTEINMLHPFREGNGRAIREFTRLLAAYNGYELKFPAKDKKKYLDVMIKSVNNTEPLKEFFKERLIQSERVIPKDRIFIKKKDIDRGFER
ncbi:Fic/DOC family protein [Tepidanaerobacter acetatoxydans]|uniref:Fic/DOC family protein n=1 Tax=Tepidanaerobacter acetatoxydans TaxID=499229 RepID=UPI001BD42F54|nr:Fic family protein [Tepidanaerobacter acetatoxydans]